MKDFPKNINPKYLHSEITGKILQGFYNVANKIGYGFGIELFRNALIIELEELNLKYELDKVEKLIYKEKEIGIFTVDILVEQKVSISLICEPDILRIHEIVLSNQLKNSDIEVGLLLNSYVDSEHKRLFYSNDLKAKHKHIKHKN